MNTRQFYTVTDTGCQWLQFSIVGTPHFCDNIH